MHDAVTDLERTGRRLQRITIAWNLIEVFITIGLGIAAGSLALIAFGLDSLIEVFASLVVLWHMLDDQPGPTRDRRARRLVALAFAALAAYLLTAGLRALLTQTEPESSPLGIAYLGVTAVVMFSLAARKRRLGRDLNNLAFLAEARLTYLDGWLATAILTALALNTGFDWWWADPLAALVVAVAAARESVELATGNGDRSHDGNRPDRGQTELNH